MGISRFLFCVSLLILTYIGAKAQVLISTYEAEEVRNSIGSAPTVSDIFLAQLTDPAYTGLPVKIKNAKAVVDLRFDGVFVDGLTENDPNNLFEFQVTFDVEIVSGTNVLATQSKQLKVKNLKPQEVYIIDITAQLMAHSNLGVNVKNIVVVDHSATLFPTVLRTKLKNDLRISLKTIVEAGIDAQLSTVLASTYTANISGKQVNFTWQVNPSAPNFEFQLMKLHNINPQVVSNPTATYIANVDWSRALAIEVCSNDPILTLTLGEGSGYYVWRVRAVGNYYEGGVANPLNWGAWDAAIPTTGNINVSPNDYLFYFTDPDDGLNYSYSRVFSENAKVNETAVYANDLHQTVQTQVYIHSEGSRIISQSIYDYSGRPSLSVLPAPDNSPLSGYKQGWVLNNNSEPYGPKNFDTHLNVGMPATVEGPVDDYYNGTAVDKGSYPVPDAEGYPYSRTVFFNDGSGRVFESSGVGNTHKIGGKTTKTLYDKPSKEELIRIFSDEAPDENTVLKTMVIDPNGITSVTYTSMDGKVIATCLSNNPDAPGSGAMDPLFNTTPDPIQVEDIITYNVSDGVGYISSKRVSFSQPTTVEISYDINCSQFAGACSSGDCEYEVQFKVTDILNSDCSILLSPQEVDCGGNNNPDWTPIAGALCSSWSVPSGYNNKLLLPAGTYIIEKRLTLKTDSYQDALNDIEKHKLISEFLVKALGELGTQYANDPQFLSAYANAVNGFDACDAQWNTLRTDLGLTCSDFLNYSLNIDASSGNLTIGAPCCGSNTIPFDVVSNPFDCTPNKADWDNYKHSTPQVQNGPYDFAGYLWEQLGAYIPAGSTFSDLVNGYSENELNAMFYHMLNDKYYCGRMEYDAVADKWYKLDGLGERIPDGGSGYEEVEAVDIIEQYTCDDLWKCWQNTVLTYQDVLSQIDDIRTTPPYLNASNNSDDNAGNSSTHDDHFDDNIEGGFIIRWLANRALSQGVRDDAPDAEINISLLNNFFSCAGFKFSGIVVREISNPLTGLANINSYTAPVYDPSDPANQPPSYYTASVVPTGGNGWNADWDNYFTQTVSSHAQRPVLITELALPEIHKQLKDRVFAFRYFEYWDNNMILQSGSNPLSSTQHTDPTINNSPCEIAYCFYANTEPSTPCMPVRCTKNYKTWDCMTRSNFYGCQNSVIRIFGPEDPLVTLTCPDTWDNPLDHNFDNPSLETLGDMWRNKIGACNTGCEGRANEFRQAIIGRLQERCYTVNGCEGDNHNVSLTEIETWVDALIAQCQSQCNIDEANIGCVASECEAMDGNTSSYVWITIGTPCENYLLFQAVNASFEIDVPSVCPSAPTPTLITTYTSYNPDVPKPTVFDQCDVEAPNGLDNSAVIKITQP